MMCNIICLGSIPIILLYRCDMLLFFLIFLKYISLFLLVSLSLNKGNTWELEQFASTTKTKMGWETFFQFVSSLQFFAKHLFAWRCQSSAEINLAQLIKLFVKLLFCSATDADPIRQLLSEQNQQIGIDSSRFLSWNIYFFFGGFRETVAADWLN